MKHNNSLKVTNDLFYVLMTWTFGFLGVMFVIQLVRATMSFMNGSEIDTFYNAVFVAASIYMFVVGIISTYFLPYYVEHGVTRKDYFIGNLFSSIGLSVMLPIIVFIVSSLYQFILNKIDSITIKDVDFNTVVDSDPHLIGDLVQSFIINPYIDPNSNWILALFVFTVNIFIFYLIGWLIGSAFYRSNVMTGLAFILVGLVMITIKDNLLRVALELPLRNRFITIDQFSPTISSLGVLLLIILAVWLIRQLTKKAAIKM